MTTHPSSSAQQAANRANAQHSTGPKTAEGKAASSQNSRRHGLTGGNFVVLAWESQDDYNQLLADLHHEHNPATPTEQVLVAAMARHRWLSDRAANLQELCLDGTRPGHCAEVLLATYLRYQAHHERVFHKSLSTLLQLRRERQREQNGFVSQSVRIADNQRKDERHILELELLRTRGEQVKRTADRAPSSKGRPDSASLTSNSAQQERCAPPESAQSV